MRSPQAPTVRWSSRYHSPVLVADVLELLHGKRTVLDGTLGGGGHSLALLEHGAMVTALDRDPQAVAEARERLRSFVASGQFHPLLGNFADIDHIDTLAGASFDGILLDLGVSSHQLDETSRGFSFREGAPLDMRMAGGIEPTPSAAELLDEADERELVHIFRQYGDEPAAPRLAREIVRRRATRSFRTSDDLVNAIRAVLGARAGPGDFARLFQAVRIAVNDEMSTLERALPALRDRLVEGGVLAVIAYHSGEDRLVKHAFREWSASCVCPPRQPLCSCRGRSLGETLTRKARTAAGEEIAGNPRARSARLRAWRRNA
ncbi:MAG TPA: 16S rRNA (cytosine(1402)-N(4))-methyltransferase RsmH [Gemmatimonadaceae bacterium]|nr:16S rRNA (cytosine(1402)-N(4))-methyltransferase RsmH [Gemmatimonadaceae bacterium]